MVWKGLKVDLGLQKNYITISWSLANEFHFHGWSKGSKLWKTWKGLKECQKWDQKSFATQVYIHYSLPQHTSVMRLMNDSISSSLGKISCLMLLLCVNCLPKSINWISCIVESMGLSFIINNHLIPFSFFIANFFQPKKSSKLWLELSTKCTKWSTKCILQRHQKMGDEERQLFKP